MGYTYLYFFDILRCSNFSLTSANNGVIVVSLLCCHHRMSLLMSNQNIFWHFRFRKCEDVLSLSCSLVFALPRFLVFAFPAFSIVSTQKTQNMVSAEDFIRQAVEKFSVEEIASALCQVCISISKPEALATTIKKEYAVANLTVGGKPRRLFYKTSKKRKICETPLSPPHSPNRDTPLAEGKSFFLRSSFSDPVY